jgi:hypothetical protein
MNRSAMVPPPQQQMFEFARTDLWRQLPAAAQLWSTRGNWSSIMGTGVA